MNIESILRNHLQSDPALSLSLHTSPEWGSQNPEHRKLIRQSLANNETLPYHSISHCPLEGGYVLCNQPIGMDIEVTERVHSHIVQRISTAEEIQIAPSPASLWTAKEACFKALWHFKQPSVVSEITIGSWQQISPQLETFEQKNLDSFKLDLKTHGVLIHSQRLTYAFFIIHP